MKVIQIAHCASLTIVYGISIIYLIVQNRKRKIEIDECQTRIRDLKRRVFPLEDD